MRASSPAAEHQGCLSGRTLPRFQLAADARHALAAYLAVSAKERHSSPFDARQQLLARSGCFQCHARDVEALSPLEEVGSKIADKDLGKVPGQRTPRLAGVLSKYQRSHLTAAIRDGVKSPRYTYRMPAFGDKAQAIIQALAEADGELVDQPEAAAPPIANPELSAQGPALVGTSGYSCVNCHLWKGKHLAAPEPGAAAPELTTVTHRIRRDYFDRWLDHPARIQPRTPMPQIFRKDQPALLASVLEGDPWRQKDALWSYFALGAEAAEPLSLPPTPVPTPAAGEPPLVVQIPLHMPDESVVESIVVLFDTHDALVYDVGTHALRDVFIGARLLRAAQGPALLRAGGDAGEP